MTVWRDKREVPVTVTIAELKDEEVAVPVPAREKDFGLTVQDVTSDNPVETFHGSHSVGKGNGSDDGGLFRQATLVAVFLTAGYWEGADHARARHLPGKS
jgi:hypothetical protein